MRLSQFAEPDGEGWTITAQSVRRARDRGITAEQVLGWLQDSLANALPPILETAIRNWSSPGKVALGNLVMLQIPQAQACAAILASEKFRPYLLGHVPPNWFVVQPDMREELEKLLNDLGFSLSGSYQFQAQAEKEPAALPRRPKRSRKPEPD